MHERDSNLYVKRTATRAMTGAARPRSSSASSLLVRIRRKTHYYTYLRFGGSSFRGCLLLGSGSLLVLTGLRSSFRLFRLLLSCGDLLFLCSLGSRRLLLGLLLLRLAELQLG